MGPFRAVRVARIESRTRSGSGVPSASITAAPARWTSHSAATPVAATSNVSIVNFAFTPATDRIKLGDTVHWTNSTAATTHTTTSLGKPGSGTIGLGLWDSGNLAGGATFDHVFNIAGAFPYRCE